jgi:hypothetical protein
MAPALAVLDPHRLPLREPVVDLLAHGIRVSAAALALGRRYRAPA